MYVLAYAYNESERAVCMFMCVCVCHLIRTELTKYKRKYDAKMKGPSTILYFFLYTIRSLVSSQSLSISHSPPSFSPLPILFLSLQYPTSFLTPPQPHPRSFDTFRASNSACVVDQYAWRQICIRTCIILYKAGRKGGLGFRV
jgi:hypothetical protein